MAGSLMAALLFVIIPLVSASKIVPMPLSSRPHVLAPRQLQKRGISLNVTLQDYLPGLEYFVPVQIGTPPQNLELAISIASADTWMFAPHVCVTTPGEPIACAGGSFDSSTSSSFVPLVKGAFQLPSNGFTPEVTGDYFSESLVFSGHKFDNLTMALATKDEGGAAGELGLASDTQEAPANGVIQQPFTNLPDALFNEGLIASKSFSLLLGEEASASGTLLFGGYDTNKYVGDLIMMPMFSAADADHDAPQMAIALSSISSYDDVETTGIVSPDFPVAVVLDSRTPLISLPTDIYNFFLTNLLLNPPDDLTDFECNMINGTGVGDGTLEFGLGGDGGPVISVPLQALAVPLYDPSTRTRQTYGNGTFKCLFALQDAGNTTPTFGLSFLQSAYVLYDLANSQVGLAQAVIGSESENLVEYNPRGANTRVSTITTTPEIATSTSSITRASFTLISASFTAQTAPIEVAPATAEALITTATALGINSPGTASGASGSRSTAVPAMSSGLSGGAIAGIVIGAIAGVAIIIAAVLFLLRRRRNNKPREKTAIGGKSEMSSHNINNLAAAPSHAELSDEPTHVELPGGHQGTELEVADHPREMDAREVYEMPAN